MEMALLLHKPVGVNMQIMDIYLIVSPCLEAYIGGILCLHIYFLLCIEILAIRIRNNPCITGLKPTEKRNRETKISYTDDAPFYLQPKKFSLDALILDFNIFVKLCGLKPNFGKCTIMRIGPLRRTDFKIQCTAPVKWRNGSVDVLGIHIPDNLKDLAKIISNVLQPW